MGPRQRPGELLGECRRECLQREAAAFDTEADHRDGRGVTTGRGP
jgi:hypothetical protein